MEEYSIDEIEEKKGKEEPEYKIVGAYTINMISDKGNIPYEIETIASSGLKKIG